MDETPRPPEPEPAQRPATGDPFAARGDVPSYDAWRSPQLPTPARNGWKTATIVLSVILSLGILAVIGFVVLSVVLFTQEVTSFELQDGVTDSCEELVDAASGLTPLTGPEDAAEPLTALAESARGVADEAQKVATGSGPDRRFVQDAADLADALEAFADDPSAGLDLPMRDDTPVTVLMTRSAPTCPVPPVVTALDPEAGSGLFVEEPFAF